MMGRILLFSLGIVLLAAGAALFSLDQSRDRAPSFLGELRVAKGGEERIAVRPAPSLSDATRENEPPRIEGRLIRFHNPELSRNWIDPAAEYHALVLPFQLRLNEIIALEEPQPQSILHIESVDGVRELRVRQGLDVEIEGQSFNLAGRRRWSGLLADPQGQPMAAIALRSPDGLWTEHVFIQSGRFRQAAAGYGVYFEWTLSEEDARARAEAPLAGIESAMWGVRDGAAIQWLGSFLPGAGIELADGTNVTLVQLDERHATDNGEMPAIEVAITKGAETRREWIAANATPGPILFDHPSGLPKVLRIYAWGPDSAMLSAHSDRQSRGTRQLNAGEHWTPEGFALTIRLDQALARAVPVDLADSPFDEVIMGAPDRILRVREGEVKQFGDARLTLVEESQPAPMQYEMELFAPDDALAMSFQLSPGKNIAYKDWIISYRPGDPRAPNTAIVEVQQLSNRPLIGWGYALGGGGMLMMVIIVALGRGSRSNA